MVKFSLGRNFPDLEIHDHSTRLKSHVRYLGRASWRVLTWNECHGYRIFHSWLPWYVYRSIWTPVIDEVLVCERERHNIHDSFAVVEGKLNGPLHGVRQMSYYLDTIALHSCQIFECLQFYKSNLLKQSAVQNKISRFASPFGKFGKIYTSGK